MMVYLKCERKIHKMGRKYAKKPFWMSSEEYEQHKRCVDEWNARLLVVLRREIAEVKADLVADQENPDLCRYHRARISILECQIAQADGTASWVQEPERPIVVRAKKAKA